MPSMTSSRLLVERLVVGPLFTNCYIVWDESVGRGAIIDPGEEAQLILSRIKEVGIEIDYILATHCHFDHIAGVAALKLGIGADFLIHEGDISFVTDAKNAARRWGFDIEQPPMPDRYIEDGDRIRVGDIVLEVLHTPGHSPGGVSFFHPGMVFAGDCLFQRSIGRTDFRLGSLETLSRSIEQRLYSLPDDTVVYAGHGPATSIGAEKAHNPFVGIHAGDMSSWQIQ